MTEPHSMETLPSTNANPDTSSNNPAKTKSRRANLSSIILGLLAVACIVLGAALGFIPILILEGLAFGALAWITAVKGSVSQTKSETVLLCAIVLSGFLGASLEQDLFSPRFRYLSERGVEYRVNERSGRTDILAGAGGWDPISFDRDAVKLPSGENAQIILSQGIWKPSTGTEPGEVCFIATNSSNYVLKSTRIRLTILGDKNKTNPFAGVFDNADSTLTAYLGGLIDSGSSPQVCGPTPRDLSKDEGWSYSVVESFGWRR